MEQSGKQSRRDFTLLDMPEECIVHILDYAAADSYHTLMLTCKATMARLSDDHVVSRVKKLVHYFGCGPRDRVCNLLTQAKKYSAALLWFDDVFRDDHDTCKFEKNSFRNRVLETCARVGDPMATEMMIKHLRKYPSNANGTRYKPLTQALNDALYACVSDMRHCDEMSKAQQVAGILIDAGAGDDESYEYLRDALETCIGEPYDDDWFHDERYQFCMYVLLKLCLGGEKRSYIRKLAKSCMDGAIRRGHLDQCRMFVSMGAQPDTYSMWMAACTGRKNVCEFLLSTCAMESASDAAWQRLVQLQDPSGRNCSRWQYYSHDRVSLDDIRDTLEYLVSTAGARVSMASAFAVIIREMIADLFPRVKQIGDVGRAMCNVYMRAGTVHVDEALRWVCTQSSWIPFAVSPEYVLKTVEYLMEKGGNVDMALRVLGDGTIMYKHDRRRHVAIYGAACALLKGKPDIATAFVECNYRASDVDADALLAELA